MKTILSLLLMFTLGFSGFSAQIDEFAHEVGYSRDYAKALDLAKKQNRPIMLVVVGDYCPWCKKFERKTLNSKEIRSRVSSEFVPIIIDRANDKKKYPDEFYSKRIPTVFFIDPKTQKSLYESMGYMKPSKFSNELDFAKANFTKAK